MFILKNVGQLFTMSKIINYIFKQKERNNVGFMFHRSFLTNNILDEN